MGSLRRYRLRTRRAIESPTLFELVYCRAEDEAVRQRHGRLISFMITSEAADEIVEDLVQAIEEAVEEVAGHVADTSSEEDDVEQGQDVQDDLLPSVEEMARRAGMPTPVVGADPGIRF